MKILYVSVHQTLEYDEIRIFHELGYDVFPLGVYFGGQPSQPFRPALTFSPALNDLMSAFVRLGGRYTYGASAAEQVIPREFVELFDVVLVMHDFDFLDHHWPALSAAKVIWRSIGVGTQMFEPRVSALRERGCYVVRYCPTEQSAAGYAGHDAIIRFGKHGFATSPAARDAQQVLTFSHYFAARFPHEYAFYAQAVTGLTTVLCGDGNGGLPGSIGLVDFTKQNELLRCSAVYYYAGGTFIPYTLNFMEAWLSGIPLVATDCRTVYPPEQCSFAEIPQLIKSGQNGFLVSTPDEARQRLCDVMNDAALAAEIGENGAAAARSFFSSEIIGPQWRAFLDGLVGSSKSADDLVDDTAKPLESINGTGEPHAPIGDREMAKETVGRAERPREGVLHRLKRMLTRSSRLSRDSTDS